MPFLSLVTLTFDLWPWRSTLSERGPNTSSVWIWRKSVQRARRYFIHKQKSYRRRQKQNLTQFIACGNYQYQSVYEIRHAELHPFQRQDGIPTLKMGHVTQCPPWMLFIIPWLVGLQTLLDSTMSMSCCAVHIGLRVAWGENENLLPTAEEIRYLCCLSCSSFRVIYINDFQQLLRNTRRYRYIQTANTDGDNSENDSSSYYNNTHDTPFWLYSDRVVLLHC